MNAEQKDYIMGIVDNEGFDYAFCDYSSFEEIKDDEFHKAREEYKKAARKLKDIIGHDDY